MPPYDHPHVQPPGSLAILGETDFRGRHHRFGLTAEDRLRHLYVVGKTGLGKSTLLLRLLEHDLAHGSGFALLDPHGSLAREALLRVPRERTNDVLLLDPADSEFPVSWNVFRSGRSAHENPTLFVSHFIAVLKSVWRDSWGPRLEHNLRLGLLAVVGHPRSSLSLLYRFFADPRVRERVLLRTKDPLVASYWKREFPSFPKSLQAEALSPIQNKLGSYLASPILRNILGTDRSRVDLASLMGRSGILIADLSVGRLGEDASALMGGLLLTSLFEAGMGRRPGSPPFIIYLDEFQRFLNDTLQSLLSESRKYGLGLVLAHQHLSQLPEAIRGSVLGNAGSIVAFRVGVEDARILEAIFSPTLSASDIVNLGKYQIAVRLLARGVELAPFTARTLPPGSPTDPHRSELVRRSSRDRYSRERAKVEAHLPRSFL